MTTSVQRRRGSTVQHSSFTGLEGEITVDTNKDTAVVHDGSTIGGFPLAKEGLENTHTANLPAIIGTDTASDDTFLIYDASASAMKKITRAELNNAIEVDALSNVTITGGSINGTSVGATTASSGKFTTLDSSSTTILNNTTIPASKTLLVTTDIGTSVQGYDATILKSANIGVTVQGYDSTILKSADIGSTVQAYDAQLADVAGLTPTDNGVIIGNGTNFVVESGATLKTSLGLTIGTDIQAYDADLTTLGAGGSGARDFLGLGTGNDVQFTNFTYTGTLTGGTGVVNLGSGQFYKDASGNIGIGTTSPLAKLTVSNSGENFEVSTGSVTYNGGVLQYLNRTLSTTRPDMNYFLSSGLGSHKFWTNSAERMRIDSAGNVGIGTTTPLTKLSVADVNVTGNDANISGVTTTTQAAGVGATLGLGGLYDATSSTFFGTIRGGKENSTSGNYAGFLSFGTVAHGNSTTERMRIDSSGNVGIGTTTASSRVTIQGTPSTRLVQLYTAGNTGDYSAIGAQYNSASAFCASEIRFGNQSTGDGTGFLSFATGSNTVTERMRIDSTGNVGIGTSSPSGKLEISSSGSASTVLMRNSSTAIGSYSELLLAPFTGTTAATAYIRNIYNQDNNSTITFGTTNSSSAPTERMRIDSSGNLLVGTSNELLTSGVGVKFRASATTPYMGYVTSSTSNSDTHYHLYSTGVATFRFYVGSGGTIYATNTTITAISDQRFKENIIDLPDGLDAVMALKPRKFDWKYGKGRDIKGDRGFIAQEFETVFPDMIEEWKDPAPEGEEPYKAVNANLIPILVKAIQEQQVMIEELKAKVAALETA